MNINPGTHVVLGGTGVIGRATVDALVSAGADVVAVSRTAASSTARRSIEADLRDISAVDGVLAGAAVAYLTAGLPYSSRAWRSQWPPIVGNVADAAARHGVHLVYFDNVYAYGPVAGPMTEHTPIRPTTRKGSARAAALDVLGIACSQQGLTCTIARSADFYGPGAATSAFNRFALDKIAAGRAPSWLIDTTKPHSMTYTPDIGAGLALLGSHSAALGRTWHLPTAPALTGADYLELAGATNGHAMSRATLRTGALFAREARETLEMVYQYDRPYVFSSAHYESTFNAKPTSYADGIRASLSATVNPARVEP